MCACVYVCAPPVCLVPQRPKEGASSLELELPVVVNHLMWVLGTEPVQDQEVL